MSSLSGQARTSELPMFSSSVRVTKASSYHRKREADLSTHAGFASVCCVSYRLSLAHTISWVIQVWVPHTCEREHQRRAGEAALTVRSHLTSCHPHVPKQSVRDVGPPCFCFCFMWYGNLTEVTSNEWNSERASQSWTECAAKRAFCSDVYKESYQTVLCVIDIDLWNMYGKNVHMYIYIHVTILHDKLMMSIIPTWKMQKWSKSHTWWVLGNQLNVSSTTGHCHSFYRPTVSLEEEWSPMKQWYMCSMSFLWPWAWQLYQDGMFLGTGLLRQRVWVSPITCVHQW